MFFEAKLPLTSFEFLLLVKFEIEIKFRSFWTKKTNELRVLIAE